MELNIDDLTLEDIENAKNTIKNFNRKKDREEIFYDLCFCIMAPQTKFVNNRKVIEILKDNSFYNRPIERSLLEVLVKPVRFYRNKARYLFEAREKFDEIYDMMFCSKVDQIQKRDWLVKNINGMGMKAASHFLRNLGDTYLGIIDTHIMKFMGYDYVSPKNKKEYEKIEQDFREVAQSVGLSVAEFDAWVWVQYSKIKWENFGY